MPLALRVLVLPLALLVAAAAPQDVRRLERDALGKDVAASNDALQALSDAGADGVAVLAKVVERGTNVQRMHALSHLRRLGDRALSALPTIEKLVGAPRDAPGADFLHGTELFAAQSVETAFHLGFARGAKSAASDDLERLEPHQIRATFGAIAAHDLAAVLPRLAADRRRARSIAAGYDDLLVAMGHAIGAMEAPPVDALAGLLAHEDAVVRQGAALLLAAAGEKAKSATDRLIPLLEDADRVVAARAIEALAAIGIDRERARVTLAPLRAEVGPVGFHATRALALLARDDAECRAGLLELAAHRDALARRLAATAMARVGAQRAEIVALGTLLGDRDEAVRLAAAGAAGKAGSAARELVPILDRRIRAEKVAEIKSELEWAKKQIAKS